MFKAFVFSFSFLFSLFLSFKDSIKFPVHHNTTTAHSTLHNHPPFLSFPFLYFLFLSLPTRPPHPLFLYYNNKIPINIILYLSLFVIILEEHHHYQIGLKIKLKQKHGDWKLEDLREKKTKWKREIRGVLLLGLDNWSGQDS